MQEINTYRKVLLREALKNSSLFWDIPKASISSLDDLAIVERLLNYGDMPEFRAMTSNISIFKKIYNSLIKRKRINLKPQVINYTNLYLKAHA